MARGSYLISHINSRIAESWQLWCCARSADLEEALPWDIPKPRPPQMEWERRENGKWYHLGLTLLRGVLRRSLKKRGEGEGLPRSNSTVDDNAAAEAETVARGQDENEAAETEGCLSTSEAPLSLHMMNVSSARLSSCGSERASVCGARFPYHICSGLKFAVAFSPLLAFKSSTMNLIHCCKLGVMRFDFPTARRRNDDYRLRF